MSTQTWGQGSAVTLEAAEQPNISRWLWLVKWILLIPHFLALFVLAVGAFFVWWWAFFAILFTGRYPQTAFTYMRGVMRWAWRVDYYGYHAAATDQYPPFTMDDVPSYPARLDVAYPTKLNNLMPLVKWLLAIPHVIILAIMFGYSNSSSVNRDGEVFSIGQDWPGVIPIVVFVMLIVVLFTGNYAKSVYDFVVGFDRWQYRVAAYMLLMTDEYPPFRLDQG
uniref:DUF4389 domain-containing protein n=1 Tax=Kribbia dieselivorans TaxID=331526 RepID=UPI0008392B19